MPRIIGYLLSLISSQDARGLKVAKMTSMFDVRK